MLDYRSLSNNRDIICLNVSVNYEAFSNMYMLVNARRFLVKQFSGLSFVQAVKRF